MCKISRTSNAKSSHIDGEEVHEFIAGLAENFGLEDIRAAIIVGAAVAARTRSGFLGAWVRPLFHHLLIFFFGNNVATNNMTYYYSNMEPFQKSLFPVCLF